MKNLRLSKIRLCLFGFLISFFYGQNLLAQKTWNGSQPDKSWANALNWTPSGVPGLIDNVIVNINEFISVPSGNFSVLNLTISQGQVRLFDGASLNIRGDLTLAAGNSLTAESSFTNVRFTGAGPAIQSVRVIGGGTINLPAIRLSNTASGLGISLAGTPNLTNLLISPTDPFITALSFEGTNFLHNTIELIGGTLTFRNNYAGEAFISVPLSGARISGTGNVLVQNGFYRVESGSGAIPFTSTDYFAISPNLTVEPGARLDMGQRRLFLDGDFTNNSSPSALGNRASLSLNRLSGAQTLTGNSLNLSQLTTGWGGATSTINTTINFNTVSAFPEFHSYFSYPNQAPSMLSNRSVLTVNSPGRLIFATSGYLLYPYIEGTGTTILRNTAGVPTTVSLYSPFSVVPGGGIGTNLVIEGDNASPTGVRSTLDLRAGVLQLGGNLQLDGFITSTVQTNENSPSGIQPTMTVTNPGSGFSPAPGGSFLGMPGAYTGKVPDVLFTVGGVPAGQIPGVLPPTASPVVDTGTGTVNFISVFSSGSGFTQTPEVAFSYATNPLTLVSNASNPIFALAADGMSLVFNTAAFGAGTNFTSILHLLDAGTTGTVTTSAINFGVGGSLGRYTFVPSAGFSVSGGTFTPAVLSSQIRVNAGTQTGQIAGINISGGNFSDLFDNIQIGQFNTSYKAGASITLSFTPPSNPLAATCQLYDPYNTTLIFQQYTPATMSDQTISSLNTFATVYDLPNIRINKINFMPPQRNVFLNPVVGNTSYRIMGNDDAPFNHALIFTSGNSANLNLGTNVFLTIAGKGFLGSASAGILTGTASSGVSFEGLHPLATPFTISGTNVSMNNGSLALNGTSLNLMGSTNLYNNNTVASPFLTAYPNVLGNEKYGLVSMAGGIIGGTANQFDIPALRLSGTVTLNVGTAGNGSLNLSNYYGTNNATGQFRNILEFMTGSTLALNNRFLTISGEGVIRALTLGSTISGAGAVNLSSNPENTYNRVFITGLLQIPTADLRVQSASVSSGASIMWHDNYVYNLLLGGNFINADGTNFPSNQQVFRDATTNNPYPAVHQSAGRTSVIRFTGATFTSVYNVANFPNTQMQKTATLSVGGTVPFFEASFVGGGNISGNNKLGLNSSGNLDFMSNINVRLEGMSGGTLSQTGTGIVRGGSTKTLMLNTFVTVASPSFTITDFKDVFFLPTTSRMHLIGGYSPSVTSGATLILGTDLVNNNSSYADIFGGSYATSPDGTVQTNVNQIYGGYNNALVFFSATQAGQHHELTGSTHFPRIKASGIANSFSTVSSGLSNCVINGNGGNTILDLSNSALYLNSTNSRLSIFNNGTAGNILAANGGFISAIGTDPEPGLTANNNLDRNVVRIYQNTNLASDLWLDETSLILQPAVLLGINTHTLYLGGSFFGNYNFAPNANTGFTGTGTLRFTSTDGNALTQRYAFGLGQVPSIVIDAPQTNVTFTQSPVVTVLTNSDVDVLTFKNGFMQLNDNFQVNGTNTRIFADLPIGHPQPVITTSWGEISFNGTGNDAIYHNSFMTVGMMNDGLRQGLMLPKIRINKPSGEVVLGYGTSRGNIFVTGGDMMSAAITLQQGNLDLNGHYLQLPMGQIMSENVTLPAVIRDSKTTNGIIDNNPLGGNGTGAVFASNVSISDISSTNLAGTNLWIKNSDVGGMVLVDLERRHNWGDANDDFITTVLRRNYALKVKSGTLMGGAGSNALLNIRYANTELFDLAQTNFSFVAFSTVPSPTDEQYSRLGVSTSAANNVTWTNPDFSALYSSYLSLGMGSMPSFSITGLSPSLLNITVNPLSPSTGVSTGAEFLTTSENGSSSAFAINLNTQPTGDVAFRVSLSNFNEGRISSDNIVFTTALIVNFNTFNWNMFQTVYVQGMDDALLDFGLSTYQTYFLSVQIDPALSSALEYVNPSSVGFSSITNLAPVFITVHNYDNENFCTAVPTITQVQAIQAATCETINPQVLIQLSEQSPVGNYQIDWQNDDSYELFGIVPNAAKQLIVNVPNNFTFTNLKVLNQNSPTCPSAVFITSGTVRAELRPKPSIAFISVTDPTNCDNNNGTVRIKLNGTAPTIPISYDVDLDGNSMFEFISINPNTDNDLIFNNLRSGLIVNNPIIRQHSSRDCQTVYQFAPRALAFGTIDNLDLPVRAESITIDFEKSTNIMIENAQIGSSYRLVFGTAFSTTGISFASEFVSATENTIKIPTGKLVESTAFQVLVRNNRGCENYLRQNAFVSVNDGIFELELEALKRIFENTGGNTSWLKRWSFTPPYQLEGVKFSKGRVTQIDLANNKIRDIIPQDAVLSMPRLSILNVEGNQLTFKSLQGLNNRMFIFKYLNQEKINAEISFTTVQGSTVQMTVEIEGKNLQYQWFKDNTLLEGATFATLSLTSVSQANTGTYHVTVRAEDLPDLVLMRNPIKLSILQTPQGTDLALFKDFYEQLGGKNWTKQWNFSDPNLTNWFGLSLRNGKIVSLSLPNNNMIGTLNPMAFQTVGLFAELENINFSGNIIKGNLPETLKNLKNLKRLDLTDCQFENEIWDIISAIPTLETLILSNMKLKKIPEKVGNLNRLKVLMLNKNEMAEIPLWFSRLSLLQTLHLAENKITEIPPIFAELKNLEKLYLHQNEIKRLPKVLGLTSLFDLTLSSNRLEELPDDLRSNKNLELLDLSNNLLDFADLEKILAKQGGRTEGELKVLYVPQSRFGKYQELTLGQGSAYRIPAQTTGKGNTYWWYQDGTVVRKLPEPFEGNYDISSLSKTDAGTYYVAVTNPIAPDLTLYSLETKIIVTCATQTNAKLKLTGEAQFCEGEKVDRLMSIENLPAGNTVQWFRDGLRLFGATNLRLASQEEGTYTVLVSDSEGCSNFIRQEIRLEQLPTPKPEIEIDQADPALLKVRNPEKYTNFQWFRDYAPISEAISATWKAQTLGIYQVRITDSKGCQGISNVYAITPTATEQDFENEEIRIYPNPVNDILQVEIPQKFSKNYMISIWNAQGQEVQKIDRHKVQNGRESLYVGNLPAGLYLVKISLEGKEVWKKITISK